MTPEQAAINVSEALIVCRRRCNPGDTAKLEEAIDDYLEATGRPRTILDGPRLPVIPPKESAQ